MHWQALSHALVALSLPLIWRVIDTKHEKQHLEVSNMLSFKALHSFWFTANELQICSLYIWSIENAHVVLQDGGCVFGHAHCHAYCKGSIRWAANQKRSKWMHPRYLYLPMILTYCDSSLLQQPPSTVTFNCWLSLSYSNLVVERSLIARRPLPTWMRKERTSFHDLVFPFLFPLTRKKSNQEETSMIQPEHQETYPVVKKCMSQESRTIASWMSSKLSQLGHLIKCPFFDRIFVQCFPISVQKGRPHDEGDLLHDQLDVCSSSCAE